MQFILDLESESLTLHFFSLSLVIDHIYTGLIEINNE